MPGSFIRRTRMCASTGRKSSDFQTRMPFATSKWESFSPIAVHCHAAHGSSIPSRPIAPRDPPIRFRKNVPDTWIGLELIEGRNHQVRRMTAAVGHPTLRLIRVQIGRLALGDLAVGAMRVLSTSQRQLLFENPPEGALEPSS